MEFNIVNENNEFKLGNILTIFKLNGSDREIAIFTINEFDTDTTSLNIAYINKDKYGYDYLESIEDNKTYNKIVLAAKDIINLINENKISN